MESFFSSKQPSEYPQIAQLTLKAFATEELDARLLIEKDLIEEYFENDLLQGIVPGICNMLNKHKLTFSFHINDKTNPYSGVQVRGYININQRYPKDAPYIYFQPTIPHINLNDGGYHCTFKAWNGKEQTLLDILLRAKEIVANPRYDNAKGPLLEDIKHLKFINYYSDKTVKEEIDKIIIKQIDAKKESDGTLSFPRFK